ncbi:MAG: LbtU family siderophore porin [Deltaproteobacteria bacterium]|nr:LbtU family siderophore porin [Deltaproteobacteria bacterium]
MKNLSIITVVFFVILSMVPQSARSETKLSENVSLGAVIEVEAGVVNDDYHGDGSDIALATVEVGLDAKLNEFVEGHILVLYEDDDTETFTVDEGTIKLTDRFGFFMTAGKMYIPFGAFNSSFISDPQTLEMGETNESAIMAGYGNEMIEVSLGVFNGGVHELGDDNKVDASFAAIVVNPVEGISFGASYLSDIADSDADWVDMGLNDADGAVDEIQLKDIVAAYSAFVSAAIGPLSVDAEYLAAADEFEITDLDADGDNSGDQPVTFNVEVAFAITDALALAAKYEGNKELFEFPEKQYGVAVSFSLYEHTSIALEYLSGEYDEDYVAFKGSPGKDEVSSLTAQLAIEF